MFALSRQVQCSSIGITVKYGNVTCYDDGSVVVEGPAVVQVSRAIAWVDGRSRKVGNVQKLVLDVISRGFHARDEIGGEANISKGALGYVLASLTRKGMVVLVKATSGGPCRSYYFLPGQDIDGYLKSRGLRPCSRRA
ncbi:hypothetical protein SE86_00280 [Acidilobus sp. 7A]|nr:hypothetical protein SE86_00280 [Acidilobus sp. 7A]